MTEPFMHPDPGFATRGAPAQSSATPRQLAIGAETASGIPANHPVGVSSREPVTPLIWDLTHRASLWAG